MYLTTLHRRSISGLIGLLLGVFVILCGSNVAFSDAPGCFNANHSGSSSVQCSPGGGNPYGTATQRCSLNNRSGPGLGFGIHAPSPVGTAGTVQRIFLPQSGGGANGGCPGSVASTLWYLVNLGWTTRSGYF